METEKMQKKYFAWINEIAMKLETDKQILHYYCKNKFLSEAHIFNGEKFRYIKSFKDLNKKSFLEFMNNVSEYFLNVYNIELN